MLVDGLVLALVGLWTHSWREARRWQAIAYQYGDPPPNPPELEHESLASLLESAATNAAAVVTETVTLTQEMDVLKDEIRELRAQQQNMVAEHVHQNEELIQSLRRVTEATIETRETAMGGIFKKEN